MAAEKITDETNAVNGFLAVIERAAFNPDVDVDKMQRLLDMQERILNKNAEIAFNQAMARLQPNLPTIHKATKGHNTKYAKYEDIDKQLRPYYTSEGFSISFTSKKNESGTETYYGTLSHQEGHSRTAEIDLPADNSGGKNAIQAKGSTISYAKRYLLTMLLNVITTDEDDDGYKGGTTFITEGEVKVLDDMIKKSGANKEKFLEHIGIKSLEELPENKFKEAETALNAKLKAKK